MLSAPLISATPAYSRWQTLVEITRGPLVESRHDGAAVVADAAGKVVAAWGDFEQLVYPRSAIKALQALPLVETGAADAFGLNSEELALACASHTGESMHTTRIAAWLDRIDCTVSDLLCGPQWPTHEPTSHAMIAAGQLPSALHNNCSGKHAGMLSTARQCGEPVAGYIDITHPTQRRVLGVIEAMSGEELDAAPRGIDGCSLPTIAISLRGLAVAMARLAAPDDLPAARIDAAERVKAAWSGHPELVSGTSRFDAAINRALVGRGMVKIGAEGMFCACLPALELGLSLKIADGAPRAAEVATAAILHKLGLLSSSDMAELSAWTQPVLTNRAGLEIGEVRPVETL
jgi:L-asparaginase II